MRWFGPVWITLTVTAAIFRGVGGRAGSDPKAPEGNETSDKSDFDMARGCDAYLVVLTNFVHPDSRPANVCVKRIFILTRRVCRLTAVTSQELKFDECFAMYVPNS
jgi:hypothetical protein